MPLTTLSASKASALNAANARSVKCTTQKPTFMSQVQKFAAAAVVSTSLVAAPAFAEGVNFVGVSKAAVSSPVHIEMAVDGMEVRPAADGLIPGTGHFHVFVDVAQQPDEGEAIPFDDAHKHFGKGQTGADLELAPGKHTLTLQFANALHESYGPQYASSVTVNVK